MKLFCDRLKEERLGAGRAARALAGALGAQAGALGAQAEARGRWASGRTGALHEGHRRAALRHGTRLATTRPRARGLGEACVRRLSCGCAHGALGQFLTQYCY